MEIIICLFLALFLFFFPENSYSISKNQYYEYYNEIYANKDWGFGEKIFKSAVEKYPNEIAFHNFLNYILRSRKKFKEALSQIEVIYEQYPDNKYVIENYKWSLHQFGWEEDKKGKKEEAFALFEKSYQLINNEQWGINSWGYILKEVGRLEESVQILERGIKLFPDNKYIPKNLIATFLKRGNKYRDENLLEKANQDYMSGMKIDPDDEWILLNYGIYQRIKGDFIEAVKLFEKGLSLYPGNKYFIPNLTHTIFEYGRDEHKKGNIDRAIAIFENGNKRFPDAVWFYYYLAEYNKEKARYKEAADYLIQMAAVNNKKRDNKDYYHIELSIYHSSKQALSHMANKKKSAEIFSIRNK